MPEPIYSGDPNEPQIALTFDDGFFEITLRLLDVLRKHNVKATFFCHGLRVDELPEIVKQTHNEGHLIVNHSYDALHLRREDDNTVLQQLSKTNTAIEKATGGYIPAYFRPPYGEPPFEDDKYSDGDRVSRLAETLGLTHIHWSIDTKDWSSPGVDFIIETLNSASNGSIILCHDLPSEGNQAKGEDTIKAVDIAIPQLQQRGLSFVTIRELLSTTPMSQPGRTYTVQPGDDLSKIAEKLYGDGSEQSWKKIYEANKNLISDPSQIEPGWVLVIP